MKNKTFNKVFIILFLVISISIVTFNYVIDPFYVYKKVLIKGINANKPQIKRQERLTKILDFKLDREKYDTIFIGSSRVAFTISPEYYNKITHKKSKNLAIVGAASTESINIAKFALQTHPEIKNIYFGLDFFAFEDKYFPSVTLVAINPNVSAMELISTLYSYDTFIASINTIKDNNKNLLSEYDADGVWLKNNNKSIESFEINVKTLSHKQYINYEFSDKKLNELKELKKYCDNNNINLVLLISPMHSIMIQAIENANTMDKYFKWKKELVKISDVYDFSYPNKINTEEIKDIMKYYNDSSHVKSFVGNIVLDELISGKLNYGILLTQKNIDKYNKKTIKKLHKWAKQNPYWVDKVKELQQ